MVDATALMKQFADASFVDVMANPRLSRRIEWLNEALKVAEMPEVKVSGEISSDEVSEWKQLRDLYAIQEVQSFS
jgi:hypothetical protein